MKKHLFVAALMTVALAACGQRDDIGTPSAAPGMSGAGTPPPVTAPAIPADPNAGMNTAPVTPGATQ